MGDLLDAGKTYIGKTIDNFKEATTEYKYTNKFGVNERLSDQMLQHPAVLAEKILKTDAISCSITIPEPTWNKDKNNLSWSTVTIPFYMSGDFSLGLGNKWEEMINQSSFGDTFSFFVNGISMLTQHTQMTMQTQSMSSASWKGSTFDGFNLDCLFVCTNRNINPVAILEKLSKACLPAKLRDYEGPTPPVAKFVKKQVEATIDLGEDVVNIFSSNSHKQQADEITSQLKNQIGDVGMVAPLGYGIKLDDPENGNAVKPLPGTTLAIHIGDWFHADELVMESLSGVKFSKELIAPPINVGKRGNDLYVPIVENNDYGFPLYMQCQIKLKPYCLVDLKKFQSYFIKRPTTQALNDFYNSSTDVLSL